MIKNKIYELRKQRGLTQTELADVWGVDRRTIAALEEPNANLSRVWLQRFSEFFGCTVEDLIAVERRRIPVKFEVGASEDYGRVREIMPLSEEETAPLVPNASKDTVAARIRGGSMGAHLDGWYAYFNEPMISARNEQFHLLAKKGVGCIVLLESNEIFFKILHPSDKAGFYNLESANGYVEYYKKVRAAAEIIAYSKD